MPRAPHQRFAGGHAEIHLSGDGGVRIAVEHMADERLALSLGKQPDVGDDLVEALVKNGHRVGVVRPGDG